MAGTALRLLARRTFQAAAPSSISWPVPALYPPRPLHHSSCLLACPPIHPPHLELLHLAHQLVHHVLAAGGHHARHLPGQEEATCDDRS